MIYLDFPAVKLLSIRREDSAIEVEVAIISAKVLRETVPIEAKLKYFPDLLREIGQQMFPNGKFYLFIGKRKGVATLFLMELEPASRGKNELVRAGLINVQMTIAAKRGELDRIHQLLERKRIWLR